MDGIDGGALDAPEVGNQVAVTTDEAALKDTPCDAGAESDQGVEIACDDPEVVAIMQASKQTVERQRDEAADNQPEFSPLEGTLGEPAAFPLEALGTILLPFAWALQKVTGTPIDMCATSLLAFVNVVVQGLANILFIGSSKPISLYFIVVGSSGERKSSIFDWLRKPIDRFEQMMDAELAAERARKKMEKAKAGDDEDEPLLPDILFSEATTAALYYNLTNCLGRLGMFVDEAGIVLGGHGMQPDNHLALISQWSTLFDAMPVKLYRKADGRINVRGKRFSMLLMGPWPVIRDFFTSALHRHQGLISRIFVSYPRSMIGNRALNMRPSEAIATMQEYDRWMTDLLNRPLPVKDGSRNELDPPALAMTEEAEQRFGVYYDEVEQRMGEFGPDSEKLDLVNKYPQLALRVAATLQVAENPEAIKLDGEHVGRGIEIARYYMSEALRLCMSPAVSEHLGPAKTLVEALKEKDVREFTATWWYNNGPRSLRTKQALMPAINLLIENGWLVATKMPKKQGVAKHKTVYRITAAALRELGMDVE